MVEKEKKPEIRFTGFTDDWEQCKLGEIAERITRKNTELESTLPLTISAQFGLVDQVTFFNNRVASKDISGYYLLKNGEFAYNKSYSVDYPWGAVKRLERYENGVLSTLYILFKLLEVNSDFIVSYYDTNNWHNEVSQRAAEGARNHGLLNITADDFFDTELMLPKSKKEQAKIGHLFQWLDHLITLQQQKQDKLVVVKKSMLEKMFPKDGTNVPEIRFAGFTDAWEQCELSYYLDTSNKKNSNNDFLRSDVLSVSGNLGIINQIEFHGRSFAGVSVSNYGVVDNGDIVYTKSPLKANPYGIIKANKGKPGIVSTLYAVYKPKNDVNSDFVQCYFDYDYRLNKYLKPLVNKGAKNDMKVSDENALTGLVTFPCYEEQTRIAEFFESFNNLITLQQQKLEKLKTIKKSMLDKMFV